MKSVRISASFYSSCLRSKQCNFVSSMLVRKDDWKPKITIKRIIERRQRQWRSSGHSYAEFYYWSNNNNKIDVSSTNVGSLKSKQQQHRLQKQQQLHNQPIFGTENVTHSTRGRTNVLKATHSCQLFKINCEELKKSIKSLWICSDL